jgi:hypothetical protein
MQRIRIIGLALVAVFALSAVVSASASAAAKLRWSLGTTEVTKSMPVSSPASEIKLTDEEKGVTVKCKGTSKGTVTTEGKDETTEAVAKECSASVCSSVTVTAEGLPWKTKLVEVGGKEEDEITGASGKVGWKTVCKTIIGTTEEDVCTRTVAHTELANVAKGVAASFIKSEKATCSGGKETGVVEGTATIEGGEGAILTAL